METVIGRSQVKMVTLLTIDGVMKITVGEVLSLVTTDFNDCGHCVMYR